MDLQHFDTDGDGRLDQASVDVDGDGQADGWRIDTTADGVMDQAAMDTDNDGRPDLWALDGDQNGVADGLAFDQNADGIPETFVPDATGMPETGEAPSAAVSDPFLPTVDPMEAALDEITESIVTGPMIPGNDLMPGVYDPPLSGI